MERGGEKKKANKWSGLSQASRRRRESAGMKKTTYVGNLSCTRGLVPRAGGKHVHTAEFGGKNHRRHSICSAPGREFFRRIHDHGGVSIKDPIWSEGNVGVSTRNCQEETE